MDGTGGTDEDMRVFISASPHTQEHHQHHHHRHSGSECKVFNKMVAPPFFLHLVVTATEQETQLRNWRRLAKRRLFVPIMSQPYLSA